MQNLPQCDQFITSYCNVPLSFGSEEFRKWLVDFKKAMAIVQSEDVRRMLNPCKIHLEVSLWDLLWGLRKEKKMVLGMVLSYFLFDFIRSCLPATFELYKVMFIFHMFTLWVKHFKMTSILSTPAFTLTLLPRWPQAGAFYFTNTIFYIFIDISAHCSQGKLLGLMRHAIVWCYKFICLFIHQYVLHTTCPFIFSLSIIG